MPIGYAIAVPWHGVMTVIMNSGLADALAVEEAEGRWQGACKRLQEQLAVSEDNAQQLQQALAVAQASCC